jgi:hypothetical protein
VTSRRHEIDQDKVGRTRKTCRQDLVPVVDNGDVVALSCKETFEKPSADLVVVGHQDGRTVNHETNSCKRKAREVIINLW